MTSCIRSLFQPENDTDACWYRAEAGARFVVQALSAMKATPTAINNLARVLGAK